MRTIINVANRLPITVGKTIEKSSGGLVSALEGVSQDTCRIKWLGWPGVGIDDAEEREDVTHRLEAEFGYVPVFLSQDEVNAYYDGFSNGSLWPILHYNPHLMAYEDTEWNAYQAVNERFAEAILERANLDDLVWIHDYHLMLVPELLRRERPSLRIGFFFHTPFPSSEVFRSHPRRAELLRGVTGADQIGFHTYGYLRHFRSAVLRILGLESEMGRIRHGNHLTSLGVYPIGINARKFQDEMVSNRFELKCEALREHWKGRRIVLGVERVDYSKGMLQRMRAIEQFLKQGEGAEDVVFVFVHVPSREKVPAYKSLLEKIEGEVGRINGEYATIERAPIHFIHQSLDFPELCALYAISDVALVTPLVDGMNLVAKEFLACQSDKDPGVLVLSEFAGAAQELMSAVIVNPFDTDQMADGLRQALDMPLSERLHRLRDMRGRVIRYDAQYWAQTFLDDLHNQEQFTQSPVIVAEAEDAIARTVMQAKKLALFLDYDGTLREFERTPLAAFPGPKVKPVLEALDAAPVDVYIISGRNPEVLADWFSPYNFNLIAEHGSSIRRAGESEWADVNPDADFSWKERILEVLHHYVGSTPGSFVEEKHSAVVWHYRQCDPEFGKWKSRQLLSEFYEMLANFPVEIHHGKKIVEVSSIHVNKGTALEALVKEADYDLILCAGDDQTDEAMFRLQRNDVLSIKVGKEDSHADYRIPDPEHFRALLDRLLAQLTENATRERA